MVAFLMETLMQLFGSHTSPYVRRLRILLSELEQPFEFTSLNIFTETDRELLIKHNPTRKIPMLLDNDLVIFDSNVIYRYLASKLAIPALTWQQENQLTLINAANDSLVELFLCKRSGFDSFSTQSDVMFFKLQQERIQGVLEELNKLALTNQFNNYDYVAISLFCLLDWIAFRNLWPLNDFDALSAFHQQHASRITSQQTAPKD